MQKTQTEPAKRASMQFDVCPHCGKEIVIGWTHVSVVTIKEYQEDVKRDLKILKEKRRTC